MAIGGHLRLRDPLARLRAARSRRAHLATPPGGPLFKRRPKLFFGLVALGILLFVAGLFIFGHYQTQALFKDFAGIDEARGGIQPRNDGGILFGAVVAASGVGAILWALQPGPSRRRSLALLGFLGAKVFLLVAHFSIFVNGWSIPQQRVLAMQTSFLFHDTAGTTYINTFVLAFFTLLVLATGLACLVAFLTPNLFRKLILSPVTLDEHRTRLILVTLLLVAAGSAFARQFFTYAVRVDAVAEDAFLTTNLAAVYYILGFTVVLAMLAACWRAGILTWGNLMERTTRRFRAGHRGLLRLEWWLWGTILLLNLAIFLAPPVYVPPMDVDRVFLMNSRGVSWVFLLVVGIFLLQRRLSNLQFQVLIQNRRRLPTLNFDRLAVMSALVIMLWSAGALLSPATDLSPLTIMILRTLPIALVLPFFALRLEVRDAISVRASHPGAPLILFAGTTLAFLAGIMLWGAGNSVTVLYSQHSGGFLTPEGRLLEPYVTGIRLLGAICLVLPTIALLWLLVNRKPRRRTIQPGPLIVSGLAFVLAMNLLLTIDPTGRFDASLGYTDVLIGFWMLLLHTNVDLVVMSLLWGAATGFGIFLVAYTLRHGADIASPGPILIDQEERLKA